MNGKWTWRPATVIEINTCNNPVVEALYAEDLV